MNRHSIHQAFVKTFAQGEGLLFTKDDIQKIETEMGIVFPTSYVEFACQHGSISTPSLLDLVTGGDSETPPPGASFDIQSFFTPAEIIKDTKMYWSGGMDDWLIAVASDCMGNLFGFRRTPGETRPDEAPLYVFDHDYSKIEQEATGFDAWLYSFIRMKNPTMPSSESSETLDR